MKDKKYASWMLPILLLVMLAVLGLFGYLKTQRAIMSVDSRLSTLSDKVQQLLQNSTTTLPVSSQQTAERTKKNATSVLDYGIMNNQLLSGIGTDHQVVLVSDVRAAGLVPVQCTLDDISVYLVTNDNVLFQEGCGEMGGTMWAYNIATKKITQRKVQYAFGAEDSSPDLRYQVILGPSDVDDGEVRALIIKDFVNDVQFETGKLAQPFSYRQGDSEFDGSPIGNIDWVNVDYAYADVYDARVPINLFDTRQPLLKKYVDLHPFVVLTQPQSEF